MPTKPQLGRRTIHAYNRASRDLAAIHHVLRIAKPGGTVGARTLRDLNNVMRALNRLLSREPERQSFALLDPLIPLTNADFAILVTRLVTAAQAFEERHAHLTASGRPAPHAAHYG